MAGFDSGIKVFFGGDTSQLKSALSDASRDVDKFAGQVAKKFEGRDLARGLATALGLSVEKIAEKFARLWTGVSEEAEKAYNELGNLTDKLTERTIEEGRARLTTEQQYQLALQDSARLQKDIDDNLGKTVEDQVRLTKTKLELLDKEKEARTLLAKVDEEERKHGEAKVKQDQLIYDTLAKYREEDARAAEENIKKEADEDLKWYKQKVGLEEKLHEQKLESLHGDEKIAAIQSDIVQLKKEQSKYDKDDNDYKALQIKINDANKSIEDERLGIAQQTAKAEKEVTAEKEKQLGLIAGIRGGTQFNEASSETLADIARKDRAKAQLIDSGAGGYGLGQNLEKARLEAEAQNAERELRFRDEIQQNNALGGKEFARSRFEGDPLTFDRVFDQIVKGQDTAEKTADYLKDIRDAAKRGIPVVFQGGNT